MSGNTVWRIAGRSVVPLVRHRHSHEIWQDAAGAVYGEDAAYDAPRNRWLIGLWRLDPAGRLAELLPLTDRPPAGCGPLHDAAGNSYAFAGPRAGRGLILVRRDPAGAVVEVAHGFQGVNGKAWAPDGALWVADGAAVRRIAPDGGVRTMGGDPLAGVPHGDHPRLLGVAPLPGGGALVADYDHRVVREIKPDGRVVDRWRGGLLWAPAGIAVSGGAVYLLEARPEQVSVFLEALGPAVRVRRIAADGGVTTLAAVGARASGLLPVALLLTVVSVAALLLARRRRRA